MNRSSSLRAPLLAAIGVALLSVACSGKVVQEGDHDGGAGGEDANPTTDLESDAGAIACRSNSDCPGPSSSSAGYSCLGPYEFSFGCACEPIVGCTMDSECDGGSVCREDPTITPNCLMRGGGDSGLVCSTPCTTDSQCAPTDKCEHGGHCLPRTCDECPSYFSCAAGACNIPNCSKDTDCPGGYCVFGSCAGALGICERNCF
jgi:hypothetical protein